MSDHATIYELLDNINDEIQCALKCIAKPSYRLDGLNEKQAEFYRTDLVKELEKLEDMRERLLKKIEKTDAL